jgi:putative transcriptional regulator
MKSRIKQMRTKAGMTQQELAQVAEVRRETIVHLEQGRHNPSLQLAHDVAKALGTTIEKLFIFK